MPCKRSARAFYFALLIESFGDRERVGIEFDNAVDRGTAFIDFLDTVGIFFHQGARGEPARLHSSLKICNRQFV